MNKIKKRISILQGSIEYPYEEPFNPSESYPEFIFGETSKLPNQIYEAIRNLLRIHNLDKDNFNTEKWNPFKSYIKEKVMY